MKLGLESSHGPKNKKIQLGIWLPKPLGLRGEPSLTAQFMQQQVRGIALAWHSQKWELDTDRQLQTCSWVRCEGGLC